MSEKASAIAYPIQGLIKYHGLRDERLRLPFHDSISVCTAPIHTHTTVRFGQDGDAARIDGMPVPERDMERIKDVIDPMRAEAGVSSGMRMESRNDFRSNIGLGASASGFAALAVAAAAALGLEISLEEISRFARRGAGSAARAVTGGFSRWYAGTGDLDSISRSIPYPEDLDLAILVALVPAHKFTDAAHKDVLTSPFFKARLEYVPTVLDRMEGAIRSGDVREIGRLAEADTLLLHGITMTGADEMVLWRPETVSVILEVQAMRREGIPCYFSIDTGATVYVNTDRENLPAVRRRVAALGLDTLTCSVGGEARTVPDHLF
ncbi:MAG: diphosphomevalonate decarboxylase [Methanomassiliicoccus sp.]|nr:diphosphomevalonate decarboxylase [Methanomassiliicoccus sp.]